MVLFTFDLAKWTIYTTFQCIKHKSNQIEKKNKAEFTCFFCFYLHHQSHGNFYKKKQVGFIEYHKLLWTIEICCGQLIYSNLTKTGLPPYFIQPILCTTLSGSVETDACFTNTKFSSVHKN